MTAAPASFGSYLRSLRQARGLTQRQLAEQVGVDHTYVSKIENDQTDPYETPFRPSRTLLLGFSLVLATDLDDLTFAAGRAPEAFERLLVENDAARAFYRQAVKIGLTDAEWDRLRREMEAMTGGSP